MRLLLAFFMGYFLLCNTSNGVNKSVTNEDEVFIDSVPFRFLPIEEQSKISTKEHRYGEIVLKRFMPTMYEGVYKDYVVREYYPGVLGYFNKYDDYESPLGPDALRKVQFFDSRGELINEIKVEKKTDVHSEGEVEYGFPYYEENKPSLKSELNPVEREIVYVNGVLAGNGHVFICRRKWEICKDQGICGGSTSITCYNRMGEYVAEVELDHNYLKAMWLDEDCHHFVVSYGDEDGAFLGNQIYGGVNVYKIEEGLAEKVVFIEREEHQVYSNIYEITPSIIGVGVRHMTGNNSPKMIIDFDQQELLYKTLTRAEHEEAAFTSKMDVYNFLSNDRGVKKIKF